MEGTDIPPVPRLGYLLFTRGLFILGLDHIELCLFVVQLCLGLLQVLHGQHVAILLHHQVGLQETQGEGKAGSPPNTHSLDGKSSTMVMLTPVLSTSIVASI